MMGTDLLAASRLPSWGTGSNAVSNLEHNSYWGQVQRQFEPFKLGHLGIGTVHVSP